MSQYSIIIHGETGVLWLSSPPGNAVKIATVDLNAQTGRHQLENHDGAWGVVQDLLFAVRNEYKTMRDVPLEMFNEEALKRLRVLEEFMGQYKPPEGGG